MLHQRFVTGWHQLPKVLKIASIGVLLMFIFLVVFLFLYQPKSAQTSNEILALKGQVCIDTDGHLRENSIYTKGEVRHYHRTNGELIVFEDHCSGEYMLVEAGCRFNPASLYAETAHASIRCEYGCADGVCLKQDQVTPTPVPPTPGISVEPTVTPTPLPNPVSYQPISSWQRVSTAGGFSVLLPPNCESEQYQGVDSTVGGIICPDFTLGYDVGMYSNPLTEYEDNSLDYSVRYELLDERIAKLIWPQPHHIPGVVGLYINQTDISYVDQKMMISGTIFYESQIEVALSILRSVEFISE